MKYTHRKKIYHAMCIQWDGANTQIILELLDRAGCNASIYGDQIMLRWKDDFRHPNLECISKNTWLRLGENDVLKVLTDAEFRLKYEDIS